MTRAQYAEISDLLEQALERIGQLDAFLSPINPPNRKLMTNIRDAKFCVEQARDKLERSRTHKAGQ